MRGIDYIWRGKKIFHKTLNIWYKIMAILEHNYNIEFLVFRRQNPSLNTP